MIHTSQNLALFNVSIRKKIIFIRVYALMTFINLCLPIEVFNHQYFNKMAGAGPGPQQQAQAELVFDEVISSRNESLLELNGYAYCFDTVSKQFPIEFWRCVKKDPYCRSRLNVDPNWQLYPNGKRYRNATFSFASHNHPPDPEMKAVKK
jgi:hypothetical protein